MGMIPEYPKGLVIKAKDYEEAVKLLNKEEYGWRNPKDVTVGGLKLRSPEEITLFAYTNWKLSYGGKDYTPERNHEHFQSDKLKRMIEIYNLF